MSTLAKLSLDEYERIVATGVFDGANHRRIEFIRGELREMNPIGPNHSSIVDRLNRWSIQSTSEKDVYVRVQNPIALADVDSEPEPDIVWAVPKNYRSAHPTAADVLLLIEVAHDSLRYDRSEKADLYADAGIQEYWIVNVPTNTVEVRRDPQPGGYREIQTFAAGQSIHPLAVPSVALSVDWLFDEAV